MTPPARIPAAAGSAALLLLCFSASAGPLEASRVADGVYAFVGDVGEIAPTNRGRVGNTGFIIGESGVTVVDTGVSLERGREIRSAIARITDRPIELVIVTHALQEFLFGNGAFRERGIPILAHRDTVRLMRERCQTCLQNLRTLLGDEAMTGTELVFPEREIESSRSMEVGGRMLDLYWFGWGATPGDLVVVDRATGVAFAGALVSVGRVPSVHDAHLKGWLEALKGLSGLGLAKVVPAYGAPSLAADAIVPVREYLEALDAKVRSAYEDGVSLLDASSAAQLPKYSGWAMYSTLHPQNIHYRYLELEQGELAR